MLERYSTLAVTDENGNPKYVAPEICNVVSSGRNMQCFHVYYQELTEEELLEYESVKHILK